MELDAWTIFAVGGVASLLIERFFYYKSKYKGKKNDKLDENPGYGERIATVEEGLRNLKTDNKEDHELMRKDIRKIFGLLDKLKK